MYDYITKGDQMKQEKFEYLQVYDIVDILLIEPENSQYIWIIDPMHGSDDFFTVLESRAYPDTDKKTKIKFVKRLIVLEFLKPGEYYLNLVRVKKVLIPGYVQVGNS